MTSIRATLRTGLILCTLVAFAAAGVATDIVVDRALMDDLDRSLHERGRWVASTVEVTEEGLELGFKELEMGEFRPARGASFLEIWQADGRELYRSPGLEGFELARSGRGPAKDGFTLQRTPDGRRLRVYHTQFVARVDPELDHPPEAPTVFLAIGRDLATVDALLQSLDLMILAIAISAALATLLVLRWVMRRSLRPLDRLAAQIEGLSAGDLSRRVGMEEIPIELEPVVRRLNELLDRLRAAFERERTFSADIAHELRTPLSGLRSSLEVELSRPREAEQYRAALNESLSITLHMQDLVQRLFDLARLDAGLVRAQPEATDLSELTRANLEPMLERAAERDLDVRQSLAPSAPVHSDPLLLSTLIRNLLDNAIAHADPGGRVRVEVIADSDRARLVVANTGARVSQQEVPRLFERFARGDAARGSAGGHHGLGLSLAQRIAQALGCQIDVRSEPGGEFVFALDVPRFSRVVSPDDIVAPARPLPLS